MGFLQTVFLAMSLQAGIIPGHDLTLFYFWDDDAKSLRVQQTYYADMQCKFELGKYFAINGGMTSYQWANNNKPGFYPFRMDFNLGCSAKYKCIDIGYEHGCFHPIAPNVTVYKYGNLNAGQDNFYVKFTIRKKLVD